MEKSQMADVFAVLTVVAVVGGLTTLVVTVRAALGSTSAASLREEQWLTILGWGAAVAITCTLGSLYLSEVEPAYPPCRYCWFQRIAMYPLALLLPIAWVRRDRGIKWYAIPVAGIGAAISTYHVLLERIPALDTGACDPTNPCTIRWIDHWGGWITIPSMALVGFLTIIAALAWIPARGAEVAAPSSDSSGADPSGGDGPDAPIDRARPERART